MLSHLSDREVTMSENLSSLRDPLLMQNEEYRQLDRQHTEYESRLHVLTEKVVLNDDEQFEETTLKKKKLQVKDRMEAIAREVRGGPVAH
jgi:uncharacterized protein YdcH (DUF465 family)